MTIPETSWFERNPKKTLGLFIALFFLGLLIAAEIFLSYRHSQTSPYTLKRSIRLRELEPFTHLLARPTPEYLKDCDSLVNKPYLLRVDANGFIRPSKIHQHPDLTLAFIGGSTTECMFVDEENRFPYLVGRILEKETGLKVNSYNSGVSGNDSFHSLDILLNKVVCLRPDIVVMMHNINDLSVLTYHLVYWNNNPYRSIILAERNPPSRTTAVKNILRGFKNLTFPNLYKVWVDFAARFGLRSQVDEFKDIRGKKIPIDKTYLVHEFQGNLQTFINICRARGIVPVLMTQAERFSRKSNLPGLPIDFKTFKEIFALFTQTIRETAKRNNVLLIDLNAKVPKEKAYIYDVFHFNDNGSKFVANIISNALKPVVAALPRQGQNHEKNPAH
jgi:lysophospholipase L1-like esterase